MDYENTKEYKQITAKIRAEKIKAGAMHIAAGLAARPRAWEELTPEDLRVEAIYRAIAIQDSHIPEREE